MDVHPGDFKESDMVWEMQYMGANFEEQTFEVEIISPKGFSSGRHTLYAQVMDSDDYVGTASSEQLLLRKIRPKAHRQHLPLQ